MGRLIVLSGVPASGKSTWARAYAADHRETLVVSTDRIRIELAGSLRAFWAHVNEQPSAIIGTAPQERVFDIFHTRIETGLRQGFTIVADACHLRKMDREITARHSRERPDLVLFANPRQAQLRNDARIGQDTWVSREVMQRNIGRLHQTLTDEDIMRADERYRSLTVIADFRANPSLQP